MFENGELTFDLDKLRAMKTKLGETAENLKVQKNRAMQLLVCLEKDWRTPAGKSFMKNVDTDWAQSVSRYVTLLQTMENMLGEAIDRYMEVETGIENISGNGVCP